MLITLLNVHFSVYILLGFVCGYFLALPVLWALSIICVIYVLLVWFFYNEEILIVFAGNATVLGACFMLSVWLTAILVRWSSAEQIIKVLKSYILR